MVPPSVRVNGYPVPTAYGENRIPVHPGPVRVDVDCQWMRRYGQASLDFLAQPGQMVPVFYAAPEHQVTTGSIGHVKQKRKGPALTLAVLGGVVALVLLLVLLAAL